MATHSKILPRKSPWTEESGWLQSLGLQKFRHDLADKQQINIKTSTSLKIRKIYDWKIPLL